MIRIGHANLFRSLGKRIRELRTQHGYTQEDMIRFGFSARHWQQIEAGRPITVKTLMRICSAFGVTLAKIVEGLDDKVGHAASTKKSQCRILLVDDNEPFRRHVRSILQAQKNYKIVAEASDGIEAIDKAEEFRPDLILLEIDLPLHNGIQVAKELHQRHFPGRILFLSVESSSDFVMEALRYGDAYIHKLNLATELLLGVQTVLQGGEFIGSGLDRR